MKNKKQLLKEELSKFNSMIGYNTEKGLVTERQASPYQMETQALNEADPEEEDNDEFDFGGEEDAESGEDTEGEEGGDEFDFGGEEGGEEDLEGGDEFGGEEGGEEEPEGLGKEDEFSAADELEVEDEVEEIDVTAIVDKSDEAKEMAMKAASAAEENGSYLSKLTDKFDSLENSLSKMDNILNKISKIESDIKTPEEKLELRSLDSYPFNQTLNDYWTTKAEEDNGYEITNNGKSLNGEKREYKINLEDIPDYSEDEIKDSFNPELNESFFGDLGDKIDGGIDKVKNMFKGDNVEVLLSPGKSQEDLESTDITELIILVTHKYFTVEDAKRLVAEKTNIFNKMTIILPIIGSQFDMEKEHNRGNQYFQKIKSKLPNIIHWRLYTYLGEEVTKKVMKMKGYDSGTNLLSYRNVNIADGVGAILK